MINQLYEYLNANPALIITGALLSLFLLVLCALTLPLIVARIPDNYFEQEKRPRPALPLSSPLYFLLMLGKNLVGILILLTGIAMLLLPGQGILTVFTALIIMDYPGKYRLEKKLLGYPSILKAINWMRRRHNKPEFKRPG